MPEMPEVETTKRGISPHIDKQLVHNVIIRQHRLRWPIPDNLPALIKGEKINVISRRGKYLLFEFDHGTLLAHLGMSGSMRIVSPDTPILKHDHVDIVFANNKCLRYNDPRRFGAILWHDSQKNSHPLICKLGPEPLSLEFNSVSLFKTSRNRKTTIKQLIMNSHIVVGVGNIYATEALFMAKILPNKAAGEITKKQANKLVDAIKEILTKAITQGGTTLRDFVNADGKPGYFKQQLLVYGRENQPCVVCESPLKNLKISNRATVFCVECQK